MSGDRLIEAVCSEAKRLQLLCGTDFTSPLASTGRTPSLPNPDSSFWGLPSSCAQESAAVLEEIVQRTRVRYEQVYFDTIARLVTVQDLGGQSDDKTELQLIALIEKRWLQILEGLRKKVASTVSSTVEPSQDDRHLNRVGTFSIVSLRATPVRPQRILTKSEYGQHPRCSFRSDPGLVTTGMHPSRRSSQYHPSAGMLTHLCQNVSLTDGRSEHG